MFENQLYWENIYTWIWIQFASEALLLFLLIC